MKICVSDCVGRRSFHREPAQARRDHARRRWALEGSAAGRAQVALANPRARMRPVRSGRSAAKMWVLTRSDQLIWYTLRPTRPRPPRSADRRISPLSSSFAGHLGKTITRVQIALHQRGLTASGQARAVDIVQPARWRRLHKPPRWAGLVQSAKPELEAPAALRCLGSSAQLVDPARRSPAGVGGPHVYVEPFAEGKAEPVGE